MARLGCPEERSLHAKGLTPRDLGLQSPWHPPEWRSSPTRFIRRYDFTPSSNSSASADKRYSLGFQLPLLTQFFR